jgi:hypothetical protein
MGDFCLRDAELEMMEAAYGDSFKLVQSAPDGDAVFDVDISKSDKFSVKIRFFLAFNYPESPLRFRLDGTMKTNQKRDLDIRLRNLLASDIEIGTFPQITAAFSYSS